MNKTRIIVFVLVLAALVVAARLTGLADFLRPGNLGLLRDYVNGFGAAAPLVFILGYAAATVAFLPGTPLTLLAGLAFGAVLGTVYAFVGAVLGLTLAFLAARYAVRSSVSSWVRNNERLAKLDEQIERQGWRMLVITRLVPIFPFNLQNYAYGLTKIKLATYVLVSAICIVPGTAAFAFAGGLLTTAGEDLGRTFIYLGIAAILFVLLSLIPGYLRRRSNTGET